MPARPELRGQLERAREVVRERGEALDRAIAARERSYWTRARGGEADGYEVLNARVEECAAALDEAKAKVERLRGLFEVGRPFSPPPPPREPSEESMASSVRHLYGGGPPD